MRNRLLPALAVAACLAAQSSAPASPPLSEAFGAETGAALVINPQTGTTCALFDPHGLLSQPFPPGSLVKVFTAIAALEANPSAASFLVTCVPSSPTVPAFDACWYRPGHSTLNLKQALTVSCDRYFRALAQRVDPESFFSVLQRFSLVDDAGTRRWSRQETTQAMVGFGSRLRIPPASLLAAYACLFSGGCLYDLTSGEGTLARRVDLRPEIARLICEALADSPVTGTAAETRKEAYLPSLAGKTGTASYLYRGQTDYRKTHGWFVGVAPAQDPQAAVCVFLLEGKGIDAARIGVKILSSILEGDRR